MREKITELLNDNWGQIKKDFKQLDAKERIDTYFKILEYALPKLSRQEIKNDGLEEVTYNILDLGSGIDPNAE
ncbi:hypothetical protein [uncultured Aquimarina sp.]|uniref:hypothetical protein n=1 Tax=uncultured Aquimarina sp. TaxID=575652 RepID=UPI0026169B21|nr:hypothetical protein [uncultured Aquimarina sp.]